MYRIDDPSASPTLPAPEAALAEGYWTEGNPGSGTPATLERASWFNMVQEELRAIPVAAGLTPSKTTYNQILSALKACFAPVVGVMRNAQMSVTAASATATFTADEIIVETALGGLPFKLASFNKAINLATTGAGGMDTGTAPVSGYVALYAIYNPTTQAAALLATSAANLVGNVYGGANMPAGYTASALVSVWPTNGSSQFIVGLQQNRKVNFSGTLAATTTTQVATYTSLSIASIVPKNAVAIDGDLIIFGTNATNAATAVSPAASGIGRRLVELSISAFTGGILSGASFSGLPILTPQTIYWESLLSTGTFNQGSVNVTAYEF